MAKKISLFIILLILIFLSVKDATGFLKNLPGPQNLPQTFLVTRVIDGDTIELATGQKVRYIGVNTPETVDPRKPIECFGQEASQENKRLVKGKTVRLEKDISDKDKYERLLRYVYVDGVFVNDYLVRQGYANVATYPPDVKYASLFLDSQKSAKTQNLGLWHSCPVSA